MSTTKNEIKTDLMHAIIILILIAAPAVMTIANTYRVEQYINQINTTISAQTPQATDDTFFDIEPNTNFARDVSVEDAAFIWEFINKYNIEKLPDLRPAKNFIYARSRDVKNFIENLRETEDYITTNNIPPESASTILQTAAKNNITDFLTEIQNQ